MNVKGFCYVIFRGVNIFVTNCHAGGGEAVKNWSNLGYVINE